MWSVPGIGSIISPTCPPQKTRNVYGFVCGFGVAFMVFWGAGAFMVFWGCVYGFGGDVYGFFGGGVYGFRGGGLWFCGGVYTCGEGVSGFRGQSVYGFRWGGVYGFGRGAFMVFLGGGLVLGGSIYGFEGRAFMVFLGGVYGCLGGVCGFRWRPLWFSRGWLMVLVCWREVGFASAVVWG